MGVVWEQNTLEERMDKCTVTACQESPTSRSTPISYTNVISSFSDCLKEEEKKIVDSAEKSQDYEDVPGSLS